MKLSKRLWGAKISLAIISLLSVLFLSVSWRILDPNAKTPNTLLQTIAPQLDKLSINVVQDWNSKIKVDNRTVIIAPLANWPARNKEQFTEGWVKDLKAGLHAGYVAMRYNKKVEPENIPLVWKNIEKDKRIFISFTSADIKIAEQLRKLLEKQGYQVFTYIKDGKISQTFEEVGKIMSTAGQHFVIDSYNSRISQGVIAEALTHTTYELKYPKVELFDPRFDNIPHLVKYDVNKVEFIDVLVKTGIPIIINGRKRSLLFFDPAIRNLGHFYQYVTVKVNGRLIEDPLEFKNLSGNIGGDGSVLPKDAFMQNLPPDADYCSKERFDDFLIKYEKRQTELKALKRKEMQEQRIKELTKEIRRGITSRRRVL
jgi:hypothetical protein